MTENMIIWTVTNKLKLFVATIISIYTALLVIWYVFNVLYLNRNVKFAITYAPMTFNNLYATMTIVQIFSQHYQFKKVVQFIRKNFWTLKRAETEARVEIRQNMATDKKLMLFVLFSIMLSPLIYLPFTGIDYNNTVFPTIEMLNHVNIGKPLKNFMTCFNYIVLFPQSYFMGMYLFTLNYFVSHYKYQAVMMRWSLLNIKNGITELGFGRDDDDFIENSECQNIIKKKLVTCVKHHLVLIAFANYTMEYFYKTIFFHTLAGISLIATHAYIIVFHNVGTTLLAVMTNTMAAFLVASLYGILGEIFQEQTNNILDATVQSNWEYFNIENRQILMIFLINLKRNFCITAYGLLPVNCKFVVWIGNKIFAFLSVLSALEE